MKIALSSMDGSPDSALELRFGRAKYFVIYDTEKSEFSKCENASSADAAQGAGIQAARNVVESGASAVISGHCGPKAFKALASASVKIFLIEESGLSIKAALDRYLSGKLTESSNADVEGHWI